MVGSNVILHPNSFVREKLALSFIDFGINGWTCVVKTVI